MTMPQPAPHSDLASLIGSRICHDLISPIGAINNGLELLVMSGDAAGPEMGLIGESVGSASARIRFFRIAFGAAGDQLVGPAEVAAILRDLYAASRLDVQWSIDTPQSRGLVRLSFLAMMCLETAMPYGGAIELSENSGDWTLTGKADRINANADLWGLLTGDAAAAPLQPAQVQFALLPLVASELRRTVQTKLDQARVDIRF